MSLTPAHKPTGATAAMARRGAKDRRLKGAMMGSGFVNPALYMFRATVMAVFEPPRADQEGSNPIDGG